MVARSSFSSLVSALAESPEKLTSHEPSDSISCWTMPPSMEVMVLKMAVMSAHESAMPMMETTVRVRLLASVRRVNRVRMPMP